VHMVSAGALLETSHRIPNLDYETLMRLTLKLTDSFEEVVRLYRLMCFNVLAGNRDDHAKNFSYLYDEDRAVWTLSPAYDLTRNAGMNGEHATTVNGKGKGIGLDDLVSVGVKAGLSKSSARTIADEVRQATAGRL
ncbi:type II toxin-antitoxin system HipA family toxin, partial [Veillonella dispar]|nr:type II toxin-antitoxin system HipA family toxin [Veillonella dispar]